MNLEGGAPGCTCVDGGTYLIYRRCPVVGGKSLIQGKGHTHAHTETITTTMRKSFKWYLIS